MLLDRRQRGISVYVTGTGAVTQLALPVEHRHAAVDLHMRIGLENVGMAGGAVRSVSRSGPGDLLRIARVAGNAGYTRLVPGKSNAQVLIGGGNPALLGVAIAAGLSCHEVFRWLASRRHVVVTAGAGTLGNIVVESL